MMLSFNVNDDDLAQNPLEDKKNKSLKDQKSCKDYIVLAIYRKNNIHRNFHMSIFLMAILTYKSSEILEVFPCDSNRLGNILKNPSIGIVHEVCII